MKTEATGLNADWSPAAFCLFPPPGIRRVRTLLVRDMLRLRASSQRRNRPGDGASLFGQPPDVLSESGVWSAHFTRKNKANRLMHPIPTRGLAVEFPPSRLLFTLVLELVGFIGIGDEGRSATGEDASKASGRNRRASQSPRSIRRSDFAG